MGSWAELRVGKFSVLSTKYDVDPVTMTVFREKDKVTRPARRAGQDDGLLCEYRTKVEVVKARLAVMGFSLRNTEADFRSAKAAEEARLEEWIRSECEPSEAETRGDAPTAKYLEFQKGYEANLQEEAETLKSATFQMYLCGFEEIYLSHTKRGFTLPEGHRGLTSFAKFMLSAQDDEPEYWFPCTDMRYMLRALIEKLPHRLEVVYDVADLIGGGYYEPQDPICRMAQQSLVADYATNEKIIVLTEGSTDADILKASLELLHPELSDYYTFMDFGHSRAPGGTGTLANTVKAFAGSGIASRIVALFDNDTAGREALDTLSRIPLPQNIKAMTYPAISLAKSYPTLGPSGTVRLDINGLACSIELFLGRDVLDKKGELTPVQWTGYSNTLRQYQGEITGKAELQERFRDKVKACRSRSRKTKQGDWTEMRALLEHLFRAFQ
jgi:hypothetical protein